LFVNVLRHPPPTNETPAKKQADHNIYNMQNECTGGNDHITKQKSHVSNSVMVE
jgi:hypothetical protein